MHTITFAYAYVCTDPAAEETSLLGRLTDGPLEVGFPPAAEAGSPLAVRNMEGLRYTGYRIGRGPVADWGRGMFVVFSNDAELEGHRAADRDPRTVPTPPMPAPAMTSLTVSPPAAVAPATGGPVVAAPTAPSSVVGPAVPADQITEVTNWEATIWASSRTIDPATDRV